ncbi:LolA family protein [Flavobacterium caseinilyticum]|uniref:Outer membrane lipoprotein carrier protein LolA n=1 Tax=Flavobacterium caseinilyticum TaxID=2541732 RepID=A0A4R5AUH5_9FLAO|nr:outer membrane lipoprotein carrier protein LolA [Flavobacterium caseinilyticum]TDD74222.1 outer membrane lipoprotein carrier protein LolA [Flavobacterium caseinilyticum]
MKSKIQDSKKITMQIMAKRLLLLTAMFLFSFSIQAQDKKAKDLLDQVTAKVKSYNNIAIDFKYSLNNYKENINQESKGNVTMKGNQYVLNFMGVTKIFDGKKTYTIVPEDEEITISTVNEKDDNAITPSKMLTFFNSGYKYSMDILQNVKGRKIQYIKLVPTNAKDQRKEVLLGIDIQTKHIYNLIEVGKKGTKTTLTVNSFKTNQPLSKNQFTFAESKYPSYYVNKLD